MEFNGPVGRIPKWIPSALGRIWENAGELKINIRISVRGNTFMFLAFGKD
jgi:hypothetical protein